MTSFLMLTLGLLTAGTPNPPAQQDAGKSDNALDAWRAERKKDLLSETGWLALVDILPLKQGGCRAGSARANRCRLPRSAPAVLGEFKTDEGGVSFQPAAGVAVLLDGAPFEGGRLKTFLDGEPDVLHAGTLRLMVTPAPRKSFSLRVYDLDSPARRAFVDVPRFPVTASWRAVGTYDEAQGIATVTLNGRPLRLRGEVDEDKVFFVFADHTNKNDTYEGGRFLSAPLPTDGRIVLDFNRAENPPCVFTPAVKGCPLPPPENRIPYRIEAGERRYP